MTNHSHGHEAEKIAAGYLKKQGYKIIELNWRCPQAEIDIVAQKKHGPITFVEVKYRESPAQGGGLDYITGRKLQQMQFAAELWVAMNRHNGEYILGAIDVSGADYQISEYLENIS